jgi:hypothetical protein
VQITSAALERARNERALVVQGRREMVAQVQRVRAMQLHGEVVNAEVIEEEEVRRLNRARGLGGGLGAGAPPPGGLGPGAPPYRQIPYRGELVRHDLFGQRDYGPGYAPYAGTGVRRERGGGSTLFSSEEIAGSGRAAERAARASERLAGAEARAAAASRQAAVEFGTANQMLYRHGALTSEFVRPPTRAR